MKKPQQLANRLEEVILNGTWIANTNLKDQLEDIDWRVATTNIGSANTIAALAQHIHYYIHGVKNVFEKGTLEIRDAYSFDFPPVTSQSHWKEFLSEFWADSKKLIFHITKMPENRLKVPFVDKKYGTYERNLNGLIEHAYYHLGQIVLLKKFISNK